MIGIRVPGGVWDAWIWAAASFATVVGLAAAFMGLFLLYILVSHE